MKAYQELEKVINQISKIKNVINILNWDVATNMPLNSIDSRDGEISTLSTIAHSMLKSSQLADLINAAKDEINSLNSWQLANLKAIEKEYIKAECINDELQKNYVSSSTKCKVIWERAKKDNDFNMLKPYLEEVLNCTQEIAQARASRFGIGLNDALLDEHDPGRKASDVNIVFNILKREIPNLIQKIQDKQKNEKILPIPTDTNKETQIKISKKLMEIMGFDFTRGRLDESAHPFCGGTPHDVRLTTRYSNDLVIGIMNTIHETGHGLYEQNLPECYKDQLVGKANGMSIHESQALFMEMQVGRSIEFCEFLSRLLNDEFGIKGQAYSTENLYKVVTRVIPSCIRTDADEVTYPMHVILRYEIEQALINGNLNLKELPGYWQEKMQEYLGVIPQSDRDGCMQDIHWHMGWFGYFPVYINGSIIAAMTMTKIKQLFPNVGQEVGNGELANTNKYMDNNLRKVGSSKTVSELISNITGENYINPTVFLKYLEQKYLN